MMADKIAAKNSDYRISRMYAGKGFIPSAHTLVCMQAYTRINQRHIKAILDRDSLAADRWRDAAVNISLFLQSKMV